MVLSVKLEHSFNSKIQSVILGAQIVFMKLSSGFPNMTTMHLPIRDDIWKTDKIERAVRAIENSEDRVPTVYSLPFHM